MRRILAIIAILLLSISAFAENIVLVNGAVIDGTGKPRALANVRIRDGKVADIGIFKPMPDEAMLDVKGMIIAPGFIDLQSLSPGSIDKDLSAAALISQGVTTAILGSDGSGPYSIEEFMLPYDEKSPAVNIAMLVGHATVRRQIMGSDYKRAGTPDELQRMSELVADAMRQGAFGLGSNLREEPASFSTPEEVIALAKVVAKFGGTIVMTARDVKEAIALARDSNVPVQVLSADKVESAEIDKARVQRVDIGADSYSYSQLQADKTISLERAIQRLSSSLASRVGLRERGVLRKGAPADLVVLSPQALASGPKYVFVNGTVVIKDGQPTDARPGQALR